MPPCIAGVYPEPVTASVPYTARYFEVASDGRLRCTLCPRQCQLRDGQRGLCQVRERRGDRVVLTTWGRSSGFCVDPIEKKPLTHFLPGTPVLSFGTAGCNLTCSFCQNSDISKARTLERLSDEALPEQLARTAARLGCRSVAYTYNEPLIFLEYAVDVARACRARGVANVAVTAGYVRQRAREEFFGAMDAANVDLKSFSEGFYRRLCGASLGPVLETLEYVARETDVWLEVTTLVIPGHNDDDAEIERLAAWMVERLGPQVPLHLSAFHPAWRLRDPPRTSLRALRRAEVIARAQGLRHVYLGNAPVPSVTRCAGCDELLIERWGYEITRYTLAGGVCPRCGQELAGRFEQRPGEWGNRRQPVQVR